MSSQRIGIYAGTFDPVHAGHIALALQAVEAAQLNSLYFLPERRPRAKQQVEHFGHRVAMIRQALTPHAQLDVLEFVDISFSVERTLPALKTMFPEAQLVFLFGSDVVPGLAGWPHADRLLKSADIVVGLRNQDNREDLHAIIEAWPVKPKAVTIIESYAPNVSSGKIREALRTKQSAQGILKSVERYSDHNWLYVSLT